MPRKRCIVDEAVPPSSLYRAWPAIIGTPGWVWTDDICMPFRRWLLMLNQVHAAPMDPHYQLIANSNARDVLYSGVFASSTEFDEVFTRLMGYDSWRALLGYAVASNMFCLCSRCEIAVGRGRMPPYRGIICARSLPTDHSRTTRSNAAT